MKAGITENDTDFNWTVDSEYMRICIDTFVDIFFELSLEEETKFIKHVDKDIEANVFRGMVVLTIQRFNKKGKFPTNDFLKPYVKRAFLNSRTA